MFFLSESWPLMTDILICRHCLIIFYNLIEISLSEAWFRFLFLPIMFQNPIISISFSIHLLALCACSWFLSRWFRFQYIFSFCWFSGGTIIERKRNHGRVIWIRTPYYDNSICYEFVFSNARKKIGQIKSTEGQKFDQVNKG